MKYKLLLGDCLHLLREMQDNSVDSIVTDPPYGISFMGKKWDYDVPSQAIWTECLRVLKPGGHLLAFAGTRTQHRMAVRIEDAGFEIRDMIAWVYGSGFPKSMDVSKAIDKANGKHDRDLAPFGDYVREMREAKGWTLRQLDEAMGTNTAASWWEGRKAGVQPPGLEQYRKLKSILGMDGRFDEMIEWLEAEREVVGKKVGNLLAVAPGQDNDRSSTTLDITAPATDAARQWQGWGTALKPALEPITVARKPIIGTVAENVLAHGTGALNIDGCRVAGESTLCTNTAEMGYHGGNLASEYQTGSDSGRWPANLIHDGSEEVVTLFPDSNGSGGSVPNVKVTGYGDGIGTGKSEYFGGPRTKVDAGSGSAARFFYCAKASRNDRNDGLPSGNDPAVSNGATMREREDADRAKRNGNHHPTVKPTDLMAYLVRLVTPPGGTVLDPFMGSGSTGKAAMREGFRFIGCELSPEYLEIAAARIANEISKNPAANIKTTSQSSLFA